MRAQRYRLRFVTGVSLSAATYGSSTFGGPITYGQRASDPIASYRYRVVPLPAGYPTMPAWIYRHGDINPPMRAQIIADEGPLDLTPVATALAVLTPIDERDVPPYTLSMTVEAPPTNGRLVHTWTGDEHLPVGNYRAVILMSLSSGRRFVVPANDRLRLNVVGVPGA
jgi:hypothetical protein